jgi:hypothetical protein
MEWFCTSTSVFLTALPGLLHCSSLANLLTSASLDIGQVGDMVVLKSPLGEATSTFLMPP